MIKFFRNIRRRMLGENRFTKYLLYAIGEVVLVVIGILIALQVSTWNKERLASKKENTYLLNLQNDLEQQLEYIDIQLEKENISTNIAQEVLDRYEREGVITIDSTSSNQLNELSIRKTFTKADPTYQDLISTGNIGLIKDGSLRNELVLYYMELDRIETIMFNNNVLYVDEMFAMKVVELCYIGEADPRLFKISNQVLQDPQQEMLLINLIDVRRSISVGHIEFMNELKEKTEAMIESLKQHER